MLAVNIRMFTVAWRIAMANLLLGTILGWGVGIERRQPLLGADTTLTYTLTQVTAPEPLWRIVIVGTGYRTLPRFRLDSWGDWGDYEAYAATRYVRNLKVHPEAREPTLREGVLEFVDERNWDGSFKISYEIPVLRVGSSAQEHGPLLRSSP